MKAGGSLAGALLEHPPRHHQRDPPPLPKRGPIHNIPIEILLRIFRLIAPPRTRDGLYNLLELAHVCRFWRVALINRPRLWSAVFITQKDRRSLVEACLERSHPVALDVTADAKRTGWVPPGCTCDKGRRGSLLPNESNPCEWHFQLESLAEAKHSNRIRALDIDFNQTSLLFAKRAEGFEEVRLALGSCRFFTSSFPQLTTLSWKNMDTKHANHLFSTSPFTPTLRSLTYVGAWDGLTARVNNLTSFAFESDGSDRIRVDDFRSFLLNNHSLESLGLEYVEFEGDSVGPSVPLPNLKALNVGIPDNKLSTIIHVPAFQHLSSLRIESDDTEYYALSATGDGIAFSARCFPGEIAETWEVFTGSTRPTMRSIHLGGCGSMDCYGEYDEVTFASMLSDIHTFEIGVGYFPYWYDGFLDDLKQLGPQLKIIRLEIPEGLEPFPGDIGLGQDNELFDTVEDLVRDRFLQGRPLSVVERMVTSGSERVNREQDFVWRCLYDGRELGKFMKPE